MFNVTTTRQITDDQVKGLLCSALEGGSNYWYRNATHILPEGIKYEDFKKGGKYQIPDDYFHPYQIIPLVEGCAVRLENEDGPLLLNREAIQRGLQLMAEEYPSHFEDFIEGNDDADTADVFLQLSLLGSLVYG